MPTPNGLPQAAEIAPPVQTSPVVAAAVAATDHAATDATAAGFLTRRRFLGFGLAIVGGLAGATALTRLFPIFAEAEDGPSPIVPAYDPVGKAWTFVVDTSACIGCGLCVGACKDENAVTEDARFARTWVERHAVTDDGTRFVDAPDGGINGFPPTSTAPGAEGRTIAASFFEPRLCMQCEDSPCTAVCPVGATYRTADGVVLVDPRRCIGCGYCVVACPYGARYIVPAEAGAESETTPGIADKCTWCYHRINQGQLPACVEICPVGARKFGDAADETSEIAQIVREQNPQQLHPEYGTNPRVLYLGPSIEEA